MGRGLPMPENRSAGWFGLRCAGGATWVVGPLGDGPLEAPRGLGLDWLDWGSARGPNSQRLSIQLRVSQSLSSQLLSSQSLSSQQPSVSS